jgi:antitoxin Phd
MEFIMTRHHSRSNKQKNIWQIQEAKAKFSELVEDASTKGYQTITKKGEPIAVILSKKEFDKMTRPKASFLKFFKAAPYQEIELDIQRLQDLSRELDL